MKITFRSLFTLLASLLLASSLSAFAQEVDRSELEAVPGPPDLPKAVESGEAIEPEVRIIQRDDGEIEEYSVNGRVYAVKIKPKIGKEYYLLDRDGDGRFESRTSELYDDPIVPQWVLFRW